MTKRIKEVREWRKAIDLTPHAVEAETKALNAGEVMMVSQGEEAAARKEVANVVRTEAEVAIEMTTSEKKLIKIAHTLRQILYSAKTLRIDTKTSLVSKTKASQIVVDVATAEVVEIVVTAGVVAA